MENIGIDLGSYKTVMSTSQNNGSIIYDKQSKRTIQTVAELRSPVRFFGNSLPEPSKKFINLRKRNFNYVFANPKCENNENDMFYLYSFIKYLKTVPANDPSHFTVSVPYFYGLKEKQDLYELLKKADINAYLMTDIVALGAYFNIKFEKSRNYKYTFVIDLGHTKTTVGLFENEIENIKPIYINGIKKGGLCFSNKIIDFLVKKHNLEDSEYVREKIRNKVDVTKSMLNNLNEYKFVIEIIDDSYQISITKEEYHELIKEDLEMFEKFFDSVKDEITNGNNSELTNFVFSDEVCVEVVGGNSFNSFMRHIIDSKFKCNYSMNADESCGIGLGYAGALHKFGSKLKIGMKDALTKDLGIRVYNVEEKQSEKIEFPLFDHNTVKDCVIVPLKKKGTLVPTNVTTLTYKKKNDFIAEFVENENIVKRILIYNITNNVEINFSIEKKNILKVDVVNAEYKEEPRNYEEVFEREWEMRRIEEEAELVGNMRNELESCLMDLSFFDLNENEAQILENVKEEMMYEKIPVKLEDENKKREEVTQKLDFIIKRIENVWNEKKTLINEKIMEIEDKNLCKNNYVRSIYKLQGMIFNAKETVKKVKISLFDIKNIFEIDALKIVSEIEEMKKNVMHEIELKKKEEEIEKKRKEEVEKKQKEESKINNEKEDKNEMNGENSNGEKRNENNENSNGGKSSIENNSDNENSKVNSN